MGEGMVSDATGGVSKTAVPSSYSTLNTVTKHTDVREGNNEDDVPSQNAFAVSIITMQVGALVN